MFARFRHMRCVGSPDGPGIGSRFVGVENRVFRRGVLTMTPSPWMIRRTGRNRFGHELARTPVANPQRRRLQRLQTRFTLFAPHAANRSPTAGPPGTAALSVTTVWLGRSDCSRRDTRQSVKQFGSGPIGGGGDSPLTHRPPGYRHDVHGRADQSAAAVIVSTRADEPFFRGDDPERSPSHTVVASPRCAGEPTLRTC